MDQTSLPTRANSAHKKSDLRPKFRLFVPINIVGPGQNGHFFVHIRIGLLRGYRGVLLPTGVERTLSHPPSSAQYGVPFPRHLQIPPTPSARKPRSFLLVYHWRGRTCPRPRRSPRSCALWICSPTTPSYGIPSSQPGTPSSDGL